MLSFQLEVGKSTKFFSKIESKTEVLWGVSCYDIALKLLSISSFAKSLETVGVVAVGQDPKVVLTGICFPIDHLHADHTYHILAALHKKETSMCFSWASMQEFMCFELLAASIGYRTCRAHMSQESLETHTVFPIVTLSHCSIGAELLLYLLSSLLLLSLFLGSWALWG